MITSLHTILLRIYIKVFKKLPLEWIIMTNSKKTPTKVHPHIEFFWGGEGGTTCFSYLYIITLCQNSQDTNKTTLCIKTGILLITIASKPT